MTTNEIVELRGRQAEVSFDVRSGELRPARSHLPTPVRFVWAGAELALTDAELDVDDGKLVLKIFEGVMGPDDVARRRDILNQPSRLELADKTTVAAAFTHVSRAGATKRRDGTKLGGVEIHLYGWEWLPTDSSALIFVGEIRGLNRPPGDNLSLKRATEFSAGHLRLAGALSWHLIRAEESCWAVASFGAEQPTTQAARDDLFALDFVAGRSLDIQVLWAVNSSGGIVGALGTGRARPITHRHRVPFPDGGVERSAWAAPFFRLLAAEVRRSRFPISMAITGYLDGLRGHIHGGYLLAQAALEAFCKASTPPDSKEPLVKSCKDWEKWVKANTPEIAKFARADEDATMLLNKLRSTATQRPTSKVVQKAFAGWAIDLPKLVVDEVGKRNISAHDFLMFNEADPDIQAAADRVDMIQMLLAAAIAKRIGYSGPLAGWQRGNDGALLVPDFLKWAEIMEARTQYRCAR
jgi:hypothetical protein